MKTKRGLVALAAMMMATAYGDYGNIYKTHYEPPLPISDKELKAIKEKQNVSRGLKKFIIRGKEIWAINEKTALKKYHKTTKQNP